MSEGYQETKSVTDGVRSSHNELLKSVEYGHEDEKGYIYSDIALGSIYRYWHEQSESLDRTERSRAVCNTIAERAIFEMAWRNGEMEKLEDLYGLTEATTK